MRGSGLAAVIEISPDSNGQVPVELVRDAYRASCGGTVVLLLNGVSALQIDRALDQVVTQVSDAAGVVYCTPASLGALIRQRGWPRLAFVSTVALSEPLARGGVRVLPPERVLRTLGRRMSVRRVPVARNLSSES